MPARGEGSWERQGSWEMWFQSEAGNVSLFLKCSDQGRKLGPADVSLQSMQSEHSYYSILSLSLYVFIFISDTCAVCYVLPMPL